MRGEPLAYQTWRARTRTLLGSEIPRLGELRHLPTLCSAATCPQRAKTCLLI